MSAVVCSRWGHRLSVLRKLWTTGEGALRSCAIRSRVVGARRTGCPNLTNEKPTTQYTITQAHRISGRSRTTIQKHVKKGKLSFTEKDGVKLIDASELARVYNLKPSDFERDNGSQEPPSDREEGGVAVVRAELDSVRKQLDTLTTERRRVRDQLQAQIDHLQEALATAQSGQNRVTMLLEQRSTDSDQWRSSIESMQQQVADMKTTQRQEVARLTRALKQQREKGFWTRLFGR